jgi:hypothetical protein
VPVAVILKRAVRPTLTVVSAWGVVIVGGILTVNVALLLVTLPLPLLTTTEKKLPSSGRGDQSEKEWVAKGKVRFF